MTSFADCTCSGIAEEPDCPFHGERATAELDTAEFVPHRDLHAPTQPINPAEFIDVTETVIDVVGPGYVMQHKLAGDMPTAEDIVDAEIVEEPAPGDLAHGDRGALNHFQRTLRHGTARQACEELLAYLTASEAVRRENPDGDVVPIFGLGEPPSLEVTTAAVDAFERSQLVAMFQRNLNRQAMT